MVAWLSDKVWLYDLMPTQLNKYLNVLYSNTERIRQNWFFPQLPDEYDAQNFYKDNRVIPRSAEIRYCASSGETGGKDCM